ncbi:MAG: hypothetical protein QOE79_2009 [Sphingomonadales bacterium]|jgi:hypothetical protein|nr:hypothetical protein [Sphingomonadales bacterium]
MIRQLTLLLATFFCLSANYPQSPSLLASLHLLSEKEEFVVEVWERHDKPLDRFLRISCIARCANKIRYEEDVSDFPLGLTATDEGHIVVTTWVGATSAFARVYVFDSRSVRKVLDSYSKRTPTVIQNDESGLTVQLFQRASSKADPALPLRERRWHWNGSNGAWIK